MKKSLITFMISMAVAMSATAQEAVYNGTLKAKALKPALAAIALGSATRSNTDVYVYKEEDGTYTLKVFNLDVEFQGTMFNIGNVAIVNFQKIGSRIKTTPKDGENNIILTPGDDSKEWLVTQTLGAQYEGTATMTKDVLEFSVPVTQDFMSFKDVTIELSYNGKIVVNDEEDENAVYEISVDDNTDAPLFNVAGQRVASTKGIVIKNGKKYISK